ncbi:MAG: DUF4867 family protein [Clostridia bacterium]|nr:DUF4867 family protein [Clostridia bacterium]
MKIYNVTDKEFEQFGQVIDFDASELLKAAQSISLPEEGSRYVTEEASFANLAKIDKMMAEVFGGLPVQKGYCYGHNNKLNAFEWHKCSEINVAVYDFVLLLADIRELSADKTIDSSKAKAFIVHRGQTVEIYSTTLHFCPIERDAGGFGCFVGLLSGTNLPLVNPTEDRYLFKINKWLIAHNDNAALIAKGAVAGITGENICILPENI